MDYNVLRQYGVEETAHKKFLGDYFQGKIYGSEARGELYNDDPALGDSRLCGTTASLCGMESGSERSLRLDLMLRAFLLTQVGLPVIYSGDEPEDYTDLLTGEVRSARTLAMEGGSFLWLKTVY